MDRGRGGRGDFPGFGNPFAGFGDPFAGFGGFRQPGSLMSSFFDGRDPFDDPFFTRPFGDMMGPSMFTPGVFGPGNRLFNEMGHGGFLVDSAPQSRNSNGPVIKELSGDDEEVEAINKTEEEKKDNRRKHYRSNQEPYVQEPDDEKEEKKIRHSQLGHNYGRASSSQPQTRSYSFSSVTYGGPNGAYYTSSTTRRTGGDGVMVEESKEADTTTGRAAHRLTRGIHDKGHTVTRNLNSDGHVDTMQVLHNLNEDDLSGFDDTWNGRTRQQFPGWNPGFDPLVGNGSFGNRGIQQAPIGLALPSPAAEAEQQQQTRLAAQRRRQ